MAFYFNSIMSEEKRGCVYFFKHIGLDPIKIGYSSNESPIGRFDQFKTYAPFGAELIGFIKTFQANKLERELHIKHSNCRLEGEWFNLTLEQVQKEIDYYSNKLDVKLKNDFEIAWAKMNDETKQVKENLSRFLGIDYSQLNRELKIEKLKEIIESEDSIPKNHLAIQLGISRTTLYKWINTLEK